MKPLVITLLVVLIVIHQDFWWWDSYDVVFGFMPVTLAYHMFISLAAGAVWLLAVRFCWPRGLGAEEVEAVSSTTEKEDV